MADEKKINYVTEEILEGQMHVIRFLIATLALRSGDVESLTITLDALDPSKHQSDPPTEEDEIALEKPIQTGAKDAVSQMKNTLDAMTKQFASSDNQTKEQKVFVQISHEEIVARILVTQVALAQLTACLNLSETIKGSLNTAQITYGNPNSNNPSQIAMTERSNEIRSAIDQLQAVLTQTLDQSHHRT